MTELREAVRDTFVRNGLGTVRLDLSRQEFRHEAGDPPDIELVTSDDAPQRRFGELVTAEMNRPFERPQSCPFRFQVLADGSSAHYVNLTYDHWISDGAGSRALLERVLSRYCEIDGPRDDSPLVLYPGTLRSVFQDRLGLRQLIAASGRSLACWWKRCHAQRVAYSCSAEMSVHSEFYTTPAGTVERLLDFARAQGATVQDVILAAFSRALARHLPRRSSRRARPLVLGTIVDTRGDTEVDLRTTLGAFLGYYLVRCRPDQSATLAERTRQFAAETSQIKLQRRYFDAFVNFKLLGMVWPRLTLHARRHVMGRVMPLSGGVSNVCVRSGWMEQPAAYPVLDYLRGAPTGPMLPMVLTPTTLHNRLNVGVTYRSTGFSRAKIDAILEAFLEQIECPRTGTPRMVARRRPTTRMAEAYSS
jgi:hypothetical protein